MANINASSSQHTTNPLQELELKVLEEIEDYEQRQYKLQQNQDDVRRQERDLSHHFCRIQDMAHTLPRDSFARHKSSSLHPPGTIKRFLSQAAKFSALLKLGQGD